MTVWFGVFNWDICFEKLPLACRIPQELWVCWMMCVPRCMPKEKVQMALCCRNCRLLWEHTNISTAGTPVLSCITTPGRFEPESVQIYPQKTLAFEYLLTKGSKEEVLDRCFLVIMQMQGGIFLLSIITCMWCCVRCHMISMDSAKETGTCSSLTLLSSCKAVNCKFPLPKWSLNLCL